jgi:AcrR family transcriptional regulator
VSVALPKKPALPRRSRLPAAARTLQLLDVAEELFADRGFDTTSIEDIAREAGVTRPVVYERLGNKEAAYLAVVGRVREQLEERLTAAALTTDDPRERLRRGGDAFFSYLEQEPRRWRILYGSSLPVMGELGQRLTDARFITVARIIDLLRLHVDEPEETLAVFGHLVSGAVEQLGRYWLRHPEADRGFLVDRFVDLFWSGLEPHVRMAP